MPNNLITRNKMIIMLIALVALGLMLVSCSADGAKSMYDTAQFEELQNNPEHASQLYEEIIEKYPSSEYAAKAKTRLAEMQKKSED